MLATTAKTLLLTALTLLRLVMAGVIVMLTLLAVTGTTAVSYTILLTTATVIASADSTINTTQ
jgi:hypothetical protein